MKNAKFVLLFVIFPVFFLIHGLKPKDTSNNTEPVSLLVDVTKIIPNIKTDIIYTTDRNFTGKVIYQSPKCYLLKEIALALAKVQKELNQKGLGLLIWDAYRSPSAQWRLWNVCPDSRYVGDPRKGGRHTHGTAVDLTIICLSDGTMLEMGTGFDDFSPKAWFDCPDISSIAKKNRQQLKDIMERQGFINYSYEWWHFDYRDWQKYPVIEINFDLLVAE